MAEQFNMFPEESNAWLDWAESLYEITPTFEVRSHAKVRGKNKAWQLSSDVDVEAKIGELIAYKIHDRIYKYGHPVEDMNGTRPLILPY
jgi:hypothetical protein